VRELVELKIALLAGTLGRGGAERQLFYIARTLRDLGADVRILTLSRGEYWEPELRGLGVPVVWVGQAASKALRLARIVGDLRRHPRDVIQSQHFYTNLYSAVAARVTGTAEIGAIRNTVEAEFRSAGRVYGDLCLRVPRLMASNSNAAIRAAVSLGVPAVRLRLLPNVVDTDHFCPNAARGSGAVRILSAGRLVVQKRFDRFLRAVATLPRVGDPAVFATIAGAGPLKQDLERLAADLDLGGRLEILDAVADIAVLYRDADVFVLSSDAEGMPNVLLEAMASGLAVVAARVGGVEEVVRHGENGLLFEPNDAPGLARALRELVSRPDLRRRLGEQARRDVSRVASLSRLAGELEDLYRQAVA
jgi:glycosyltransferase involved in cell wall biosynthesis